MTSQLDNYKNDFPIMRPERIWDIEREVEEDMKKKKRSSQNTEKSVLAAFCFVLPAKVDY